MSRCYNIVCKSLSLIFQSIIEDLTMGDGSLSLSIGREGTFASNLDTQEDLPLDDNQYFKSKVSSKKTRGHNVF